MTFNELSKMTIYTITDLKVASDMLKRRCLDYSPEGVEIWCTYAAQNNVKLWDAIGTMGVFK